MKFIKFVLIVVIIFGLIAIIGGIADDMSASKKSASVSNTSVKTVEPANNNDAEIQSLDLKNAALSKANMTLAKVSQEKIDELTKKVEQLEAEVKYMEAMTLIENEPEKCEAYIELYERVCVEYAYYIIYSGTEPKANAFYVLSLGRDYCGEYATIIDITEEDIAGMESSYSEKEAIEQAGESLNPPENTKNSTKKTKDIKEYTSLVDRAYDVMLDFVTEKPGKWGDLDWCELYIVCIGDPPEEATGGMFMIKKGTCEADTEYVVYYADGATGKCNLICTFGAGHSDIYENPEFGDYYRVYSHMGYGAVYRLDRDFDGNTVEYYESVYVPEREINDASELIERGWRKLEGTKLSELCR